MAKMTDEELINAIETNGSLANSDFLNYTDLQREREKATYEYAGQAKGHLIPQGVSTIVDSGTTEAIDGYTAVISELLFDNNKIARFSSTDPMEPNSVRLANQGQDMVNHEIFIQNKGWKIMNTWIKSALMWKASLIRWDWVNDFHYVYDEYDEVDPDRLDMLLSSEDVELVGDLQFENKGAEGQPQQMVYVNVRLRTKTDNSYAKLRNVAPENFSIDRSATSFDDFSFISIVEEDLTRSDLRVRFPEKFKKFKEVDWEELSSETQFNSADEYTRKDVIGTDSTFGNDSSHEDTYSLNECWLYADRDGDGISELKHVILSGTYIVFEEDMEKVNLAVITPIEIPHEFHGLSIADVTRSSTMTSTAVLRGFVENVYLTNFSPRLADPNVVDFAALQNMKPKQIIPVNGNPTAAVAMLQPDTISTGTVPLLQHMQTLKEQSNGLSKAAQGLNDTLYVSGNSEGKLNQVQSAAQKRIQHIARRIVETGMNDMVKGMYNCIIKNARGNRKYQDRNGIYAKVNIDELPTDVHIIVDANIGENSNTNLIEKYGQVGTILGQLKEAGREIVVSEVADARLASLAITALDLNPTDYIEDFSAPEFMQRVEEAQKQAQAQQDKENELAKIKQGYEAIAAEANARLVSTQADNAKQDNARQLAVAMDTHHQHWAELAIKADKEGTPRPIAPDMSSLMKVAYGVVKSFGPGNEAKVDERLELLAQMVAKMAAPQQ
jgi:hypothetical protein